MQRWRFVQHTGRVGPDTYCIGYHAWAVLHKSEEAVYRKICSFSMDTLIASGVSRRFDWSDSTKEQIVGTEYERLKDCTVGRCTRV